MSGDSSAIGSAEGVGLNLATGNWIGAALGFAGLATSLFGGAQQVSNAKQEAQISSNIIGSEQQENTVRQQAMTMSAQRSQIENLRTSQRARAMAVQAGATQTGSLTGSGVQGGMAETTAEGAWGSTGINQQLAFGNQMYGIDTSISAQKQQLALLKGSDATAQGLTSLGGSIMKAGPLIGSLFGKA
jgi:hypothetical protein